MDATADPAGQIQAILEPLRAGGATDFQATTHPVWVIGLAPSGRALRIVRRADLEEYHVSRLDPGQAAHDELGIVPGLEAAVACALQAE
jgi:hypothetical protein